MYIHMFYFTHKSYEEFYLIFDDDFNNMQDYAVLGNFESSDDMEISSKASSTTSVVKPRY